jgi:methylated-DNA-[protein]-cysteine S-methyltransferase
MSRIPDFANIAFKNTARAAKKLGGVELSRDVGQALGRNPCPIVVPCHRVLAAGNKPGGFSANGGVVTKLKMLAIEGAVVNHTPNLFD